MVRKQCGPSPAGKRVKQAGADQDANLAEALQICELCYLKRLSQKAVAHQLGISQATVSRRLQEAWEAGWVRFLICPPRHCEIGTALTERLRGQGIREVVVSRGRGVVGHAAA